jgi:hypothetical protein
MMSRAILTVALSSAILAAFSMPASLPGSKTLNLSGSAHAATNLNSSRSNIYRTKTVKSSKSNTSDRTTTVKSSKSNTSDRKGTNNKTGGSPLGFPGGGRGY